MFEGGTTSFDVIIIINDGTMNYGDIIKDCEVFILHWWATSFEKWWTSEAINL